VFVPPATGCTSDQQCDGPGDTDKCDQHKKCVKACGAVDTKCKNFDQKCCVGLFCVAETFFDGKCQINPFAN